MPGPAPISCRVGVFIQNLLNLKVIGEVPNWYFMYDTWKFNLISSNLSLLLIHTGFSHNSLFVLNTSWKSGHTNLINATKGWFLTSISGANERVSTQQSFIGLYLWLKMVGWIGHHLPGNGMPLVQMLVYSTHPWTEWENQGTLESTIPLHSCSYISVLWPLYTTFNTWEPGQPVSMLSLYLPFFFFLFLKKETFSHPSKPIFLSGLCLA